VGDARTSDVKRVDAVMLGDYVQDVVSPLAGNLDARQE
jgi:hypothetical protein